MESSDNHNRQRWRRRRNRKRDRGARRLRDEEWRMNVRSSSDGRRSRNRRSQNRRRRRSKRRRSPSRRRSYRGGGGGGGERRYDEDSLSGSGSDYDDTIGAYLGNSGDIIDGRYQVVKELGVGTFGRVLDCYVLPTGTNQLVAIKVVRAVERYSHSARMEAEIIEHITAVMHGNATPGMNGMKSFLRFKPSSMTSTTTNSPPSLLENALSTKKNTSNKKNHYCVHLIEWFTWKIHTCLVFEKLGPSLLDILKEQNYAPFEVMELKRISIMLLSALQFLHEECHLVHTDLKVENILYTMDMKEIRLIDFGGATYNDVDETEKASIINTRQYRSPEVIFELGWSYPSDIWSFGCILMELFSGELFFNTHDDYEHISLIDRILGPLPLSFGRRVHQKCGANSKYFRYDGSFQYPSSRDGISKESIDFVRSRYSLLEFIRRNYPESQSFDSFYTLVQNLLKIEPSHRVTARQALQYTFFH